MCFHFPRSICKLRGKTEMRFRLWNNYDNSAEVIEEMTQIKNRG
jgi:hypothetical protein